jgi:hypothetical protein
MQVHAVHSSIHSLSCRCGPARVTICVSSYFLSCVLACFAFSCCWVTWVSHTWVMTHSRQGRNLSVATQRSNWIQYRPLGPVDGQKRCLSGKGWKFEMHPASAEPHPRLWEQWRGQRSRGRFHFITGSQQQWHWRLISHDGLWKP